MVFLANALISTGILGGAASTFGMPLLARLIRFIPSRVKSLNSGKEGLDFDILVAAHNEEALISQTLTSFLSATASPKLKVRIAVGADHCADQTEAVARKWASQNRVHLEIVHNPEAAGKWNMLRALIRSSQAEWLALVDVGSVWSADLMSAATSHMRNPDVMAISPSYRAIRSGLLEKLNWRFESFLKSLESNSGGPVSVHGATVFYRRSELLQAMERLQGETWLNDDVVIPLVLRTSFPKKKIVYLRKFGDQAFVNDYGVREVPHVEFGRRKRMLIGNLQWIRAWYLPALASELTVGLLASRRVFRAFWAYWITLLGIGILLRLSLYLSLPVVGMALALIAGISGRFVPLRGSIERVRAAFYAGLELPFYWINLGKTKSEKIWN